MNPLTCRQKLISRTLNHAPTHHKQALVAAGAVQAFLQGGNERVTPGFDFVFHGKDVLPLAARLGFGLADVLLEALGVFHAERHAGLAFQVLELELELGVFEGLLGRGDAVFGPGFELIALLLEELVVELQGAAEGGLPMPICFLSLLSHVGRIQLGFCSPSLSSQYATLILGHICCQSTGPIADYAICPFKADCRPPCSVA